MKILRFSFCESSTASSRSPWHIRALENETGLKLGGGIDTPSLCSLVRPPYGWDLQARFDGAAVDDDWVCTNCRDRYKDYLRIGELYFEHEGKKYIMMSTIEGLERQLLDGVAKFQWLTLLHPTPERPAYLMEFDLRRRLNKSSPHWFNAEHLRIHVPKDRVSETLLATLSSLPSHASSSTGTSSGRKTRTSPKKTTRGSRS